MPRRALGPELKRVPFRATVTPQDQAWIDQTVGIGRRWPTTSALIEDAFVFMRELAALEAQVRQDYLRNQAELLRQAQRRAAEAAAPLVASGVILAPLQRLRRASAPSEASPSVDLGAEGQDEPLPEIRRVEIPDASGGPEWETTQSAPDRKKEYEQNYQKALLLRHWPEMQRWAELLGSFDNEPRLVFEDGQGGQVYQRGSKREYRTLDGLESSENPTPH